MRIDIQGADGAKIRVIPSVMHQAVQLILELPGLPGIALDLNGAKTLATVLDHWIKQKEAEAGLRSDACTQIQPDGSAQIPADVVRDLAVEPGKHIFFIPHGAREFIVTNAAGFAKSMQEDPET